MKKEKQFIQPFVEHEPETSPEETHAEKGVERLEAPVEQFIGKETEMGLEAADELEPSKRSKLNRRLKMFVGATALAASLMGGAQEAEAQRGRWRRTTRQADVIFDRTKEMMETKYRMEFLNEMESTFDDQITAMQNAFSFGEASEKEFKDTQGYKRFHSRFEQNLGDLRKATERFKAETNVRGKERAFNRLMRLNERIGREVARMMNRTEDEKLREYGDIYFMEMDAVYEEREKAADEYESKVGKWDTVGSIIDIIRGGRIRF